MWCRAGLPVTGEALQRSPAQAWLHHQVTSQGPGRGRGVSPLDKGVSFPHTLGPPRPPPHPLVQVNNPLSRCGVQRPNHEQESPFASRQTCTGFRGLSRVTDLHAVRRLCRALSAWLLLLLSGFGFPPDCLGQQLLSLQEFSGRMFPKAMWGWPISAGSAPIGRKGCSRHSPATEPC